MFIFAHSVSDREFSVHPRIFGTISMNVIIFSLNFFYCLFSFGKINFTMSVFSLNNKDNQNTSSKFNDAIYYTFLNESLAISSQIEVILHAHKLHLVIHYVENINLLSFIVYNCSKWYQSREVCFKIKQKYVNQEVFHKVWCPRSKELLFWLLDKLLPFSTIID